MEDEQKNYDEIIKELLKKLDKDQKQVVIDYLRNVIYIE
ncbi:MAG: hypothetical protein JWM44_3113 [Bacilli bacterium]|nr:hypothetical protein [Bacilli bacterium]